MEKKEQRENEIDLLELCYTWVLQWKKIVIVTVLAALIAFFASAFIMTPKYSSSARLYVTTESTSITSLADIQVGESLTGEYVEMVTIRPVMDKVIENLGLDMDYGDLSKILTVSNPADTRFLDITCTCEDPVQAKIIVDEVADVTADTIADKLSQDPPNIVFKGYDDEGKVSPSIKKNTEIGAAVGFVLTLIVLAVIHLTDDSLITPDDIQDKVGLSVLGSIPDDIDEVSDQGKKIKNGRRKNRKREKKSTTKAG